MYYCSLCLIVRDEACLREFIDYYYTVLKFDHFYITDHKSNPPLDTIIADYIAQGIVTYRYDTRPGPQVNVYNECIREHADDTRWLALFDSDEFLVLKRHNNIREFLRNYEEYGSLSICWYLFGSNGHIARPPFVIPSYTKRYEKSCHYKTIVQPKRVENFHIHHVLKYRPGYFGVDEAKNQINGPYTINQTTELSQLNHYVLRSLADYKIKMARGCADGSGRKTMSFFDIVNSKSIVDDYTILERISAVKGIQLSPYLASPKVGVSNAVKKEQQLPPAFDWEAYLINNSDIVGISPTQQFAITHWLQHGHEEQRKYQWENGKDKWIGYLDRYPDLRKNGVKTKEQAIQHYVRRGKSEGRIFI